MKKIFSLIFVFSLLFAQNVWCAMSSTNYYIYADTVSVGGELSSGGDYGVQDTVGESFVGSATSSSYEIKGGYQSMEQGELSLSISDASLSFGTLTDNNASSTVSTTVSVSSSGSGFSLSISNVSGSILTDVSDGAVDGDSNSEEYGLGVTGSEASFADDRAVVDGLSLASSPTAIDSQTVLTFKAIRNALTTVGSYSQDITLAVSASL